MEGILVEEKEVEENQVDDLWNDDDGMPKDASRLSGKPRLYLLAAMVGFAFLFSFFGTALALGIFLQTQSPRQYLAVFGLFLCLHLAIPFVHRWLKRAFFVLGILGLVSFGVSNLFAAPSYFGGAAFCYVAMVGLAVMGRKLAFTRLLHPWGERGLRSLEAVLKQKNLPQLEQIYRKGNALRLALFFPASQNQWQGKIDIHFVGGFAC